MNASAIYQGLSLWREHLSGELYRAGRSTIAMLSRQKFSHTNWGAALKLQLRCCPIHQLTAFVIASEPSGSMEASASAFFFRREIDVIDGHRLSALRCQLHAQMSIDEQAGALVDDN